MSADTNIQTTECVADLKQNVSEPKRRLLGNPKWTKGVSGNPGGHAAVLAKRWARVAGLSGKAIDVYEELLGSGTEATRKEIAKDILDRTFGKPKQHAEVTVNTVDWTKLHLEALRALAERPTLDLAPPQHDPTQPTDRTGDDT